MTDRISRADAVKTVIRKCSPICAWQVGTQQYPDCVVAEINALPSADAVSRENCDQCKIDQVGVLEQQLAELRGDYDTLKKAYEEALSADAIQTELPQYEEWQDSFNKMCESARPKTFVADEWYHNTFKEED